VSTVSRITIPKTIAQPKTNQGRTMSTSRSLIAAILSASVSVGSLAGTWLFTRPASITVDVPSVVYVDHPCSTDVPGCYDVHTPNVIYVRSDFQGEPYGQWIVAHETGHFTQYRDGLPFDECAAEDYAFDVTNDITAYYHDGYSEGCGHIQ